MKIALVVHDFLKGVGHGRYCIELARRLSREHEVHVFANQFEDAVCSELRMHMVPAWRQTALTTVMTFARSAEKRLSAEKFDIVHAQGYSCIRANVITAHVCNAARYQISPARRFKDKLFPAFVIPREREFYRRNIGAEVISVSYVLQRELENEYQCSAEHVIYHGVNCDEFTPAKIAKATIREELGLRTEGWWWMFAGEATKGLAQTMRALPQFPEARLLVASRSPTFGRLARELGVHDRVVFVGPTDNIARLYQAADVFVYPSRYDTFGMVVAEAMACGLPVVVGKDIGAAEWIRDSENGFLCDPNDIASALRKTRFQDVHEQARVTALAHTWDNCASQTVEVYERATASRRQNE